MRKFKVRVNGNIYDVEVEEINSSSAFNYQPAAPIAAAPQQAEPVAAAAEEPAKEAEKPATPAPAAAPANGVKVLAPMPGVVLRTTSSNGTVVNRGDVILVLEALKMENEIVATAGGVLNYTVTAGSNVNSGDVLAVIS